jgi:predicted  nucleic acid-binding Zn-ribbon protein
MEMQDFKPKSFWKRPEGATGAVFMAAIAGGIAFLIATNADAIAGLFASTITLVATLAVLGAVIYMILDPRMRNLIWYMYKSVMRSITGMFVQIDPIGILKSYTDDLGDNLGKMNKQIGKLKGQMHKLKELIVNNQKEIKNNLTQASKAREVNKKNIMILKSRKAGRLKESNMRLEDLYKKMEVLYRVLSKMYENSEILLEDVKDQVMVKEQEYKAIKASASAMKSAASVISGNPDKRAMFDMAMEAVADDVSNKVGEMERFMEMSSNFMDSVDLQNGVFEEEGLNMLEKWEKEGVSRILGEEKTILVNQANSDSDVLDLNEPIAKPMRETGHQNQYDSLFD